MVKGLWNTYSWSLPVVDHSRQVTDVVRVSTIVVVLWSSDVLSVWNNLIVFLPTDFVPVTE